jgi:hypothetical protein
MKNSNIALHEFANLHNDKVRWSEVYLSHDGTYVVRMFIEETLVDERRLEGKGEAFAEDCAENFVMGVIHGEL